MAATNDGSKQRRKILALSAAFGTALLVAVATAIGTGLGSSILDRFQPDPDLISSSAVEEVQQCRTHLFVREGDISGLLSGAVPAESDWSSFYRRHNAVISAKSLVGVSIQGESARTVTLDGIEFDVQRRPRPAGAVFAHPCGGPATGRFVAVDLDRETPRIAFSSADPDALVGVSEAQGGGDFEPITFPWTVSVTHPLSLVIVARTRRCYCTWRAYIRWSSGGKTGRIAVDNDGEGCEVVGSERLRFYSAGRGMDPERENSADRWTVT